MQVSDEPRWHRKVRILFILAFFVVWLEAASCFGYFQMLLRRGSPVVTSELSAAIVNHSQVFYVAGRQKQLYELLLRMMMIGIPGIMLAALILHFLVGVKIFARRSI
jgi:hypothetical protein